ncbi:MAG: lysophospholipid acyltransferase family protein [Gemmatimonadaceae bacterium]
MRAAGEITSPRERRRAKRVAWAARLGPVLVRLIGSTWRVTAHNSAAFEALRRAERPFIFALWHGEMLPLLWHHRRQGVAVLISTHADGESIARICQSLGYRTIRGSTSRGGARALVETVRLLAAGVEVAITPDGPRGPVHSIAPGILFAAGRANAPIVPIHVGSAGAWRLGTWDSFMIPRPFARVTIRYGDPITVRQGEGAAAGEDVQRLERAFRDLSDAPA